jgi:iron(III) transport system ATP-binding protein
VAGFVTHANFLPAFRDGNFWKTEIGEFKIPVIRGSQEVTEGELMLREEDIMLYPDDNALVEVSDRQFLGREYRYCLRTASGQRLHARTAINMQLAIGTKVRISVNNGSLPIFAN